MKYPENYIQVQQNSAEWLHLRCGNVTASRVADVMGVLKRGGESAERRKYKMDLLTEILTGRAAEKFVTNAMAFGIENELLARETYALSQRVEVERIGYVKHPHIARAGASPDGLIDADGLVEIKVPTTATHLDYLMADVVPDKYKPQMLWQMACTEREYCDFVSYDPRLPAEFGLFVKRFPRDDKAIFEMEVEVEKFIAEIEAMAQVLLRRKQENPVDLRNVPLEPIEDSGLPKAEIPSAAEWF